MREMNTWLEVDKEEAGRMIKALDGKQYNNRIVRMNEADGGFKRPNDEGNNDRRERPEGRKRIYAPRERK